MKCGKSGIEKIDNGMIGFFIMKYLSMNCVPQQDMFAM